MLEVNLVIQKTAKKKKSVGALAAKCAAVNFLEDPDGLHSASMQTEFQTLEII